MLTNNKQRTKNKERALKLVPFRFVEGFVDGGEAFVVGGVDVAVPLIEPGEEIFEGGEDGGEAFSRPSPGALGLLVVARESLGLLGVVPTGPGDNGGFINAAFGAGVVDPTLFGEIEFAAQFQ